MGTGLNEELGEEFRVRERQLKVNARMPQKGKENIKLWQLQRDKVLSTDETFSGISKRKAHTIHKTT